jgi:hypothetical protein
MVFRYKNSKLLVIFIMGIVTTIYSVGEVGLALWYNSLVIFADGLHNLSDGLALAVAFWAENKKLKVTSFCRCCLILCEDGRGPDLWLAANGAARWIIQRDLSCFHGHFRYFASHSQVHHPRWFVVCSRPPLMINSAPPSDGDIQFIIIAGVGIVINVVGTILFSIHGGGHG